MVAIVKHSLAGVVVTLVALAIINNVAALAPVKKIVMGGP